MIPAREALERLREGNRRFASNMRSQDTLPTHTRRAELANEQQPFAIVKTELRHDEEALVRHAVRTNVLASANHLRHGSDVLEQLIQNDGLVVVGAEYSLGTGVVDFFDVASAARC